MKRGSRCRPKPSIHCRAVLRAMPVWRARRRARAPASRARLTGEALGSRRGNSLRRDCLARHQALIFSHLLPKPPFRSWRAPFFPRQTLRHSLCHSLPSPPSSCRQVRVSLSWAHRLLLTLHSGLHLIAIACAKSSRPRFFSVFFISPSRSREIFLFFRCVCHPSRSYERAKLRGRHRRPHWPASHPRLRIVHHPRSRRSLLQGN